MVASQQPVFRRSEFRLAGADSVLDTGDFTLLCRARAASERQKTEIDFLIKLETEAVLLYTRAERLFVLTRANFL
jgi:hypothetical protein